MYHRTYDGLCSCRPAGWEHISQFIAQATRAKEPFSKEDCIAKYQQLHAAPAGPQKVVAPAVAATAPATAKSAPERPSRREPRVRKCVWCLRHLVLDVDVFCQRFFPVTFGRDAALSFLWVRFSACPLGCSFPCPFVFCSCLCLCFLWLRCCVLLVCPRIYTLYVLIRISFR